MSRLSRLLVFELVSMGVFGLELEYIWMVMGFF